jgi:hypothetical protein
MSAPLTFLVGLSELPRMCVRIRAGSPAEALAAAHEKWLDGLTFKSQHVPDPDCWQILSCEGGVR